MKLSQKRRDAIYEKIHQRIINLRLEFQHKGYQDHKLAQAITPLFGDVLAVVEAKPAPPAPAPGAEGAKEEKQT